MHVRKGHSKQGWPLVYATAQIVWLILRTLRHADKQPLLTGQPDWKLTKEEVDIINKHSCQLGPRGTHQSYSVQSLNHPEPFTVYSWPKREERKGKICYLDLSTFFIQIIASQYFSQKKEKKIHFPLFLWLPDTYENPIWLPLFFLPSQFMYFHPLKVISDLWVSFPERMIAVFYGGGERSRASHQGWCPLENDWAGRADRSTAVPLEIQPVALHRRRKDDALYLSPASSFPLFSLYHSFLLLFSHRRSLFFSISPSHTHRHTYYISF